MSALVVYYSLSGHARTLATALAKELGADIEEIHCSRYRTGFSGFLKAARDSWSDRLPPISPLSRDPSQYDLVVIAGPIWAWHPSTPLRAFLRQYAAKLDQVAFLLAHGGSAGEKSLREMQQHAGKRPVGQLAVREVLIRSGKFQDAIASFATVLRMAKAA